MRKKFIWGAFALAAAAVALALYIRFEYTLVSELRETFAGTDRLEGGALGRVLFDTRGCAGCHSLRGISEASIGPDLSELAARSSREAIKTSIAEPDEDIAVGCGGARCPSGLMPRYSQILDDREIESLVDFLTGSHDKD